MRDKGLNGVRWGRAFNVTTISDENQHCPSDFVDRQFSAVAPNRLWVVDLTYVKTSWIPVVVATLSRMESRCYVTQAWSKSSLG